MQIKFEDAYLQYVSYIESRLKFQSIRKIKSRIENHILDYFRYKNIFSINKFDIIDWETFINKKQLSYTYKKTLFYELVSFLNFCIKFYDLDKNVASIVGNFKNTNNEKFEYKFYNLEEFNKFIKYVDNNIYKQFFTTMFFTGIRPGEAMALRFSDLKDNILFINKTISKEYKNGERVINSPKTFSSIRSIAIDNKLCIDLLLLRKYYEEKYNLINYDYFIFGGLKPLSPTNITRIKNIACSKSNLHQIRLHDFRHSHATLLLNNDIYLKEITRRLGHSKTSTTLDIYIHTDLEQEKKVIKTLNSLRLN